MFIFYDFEVFKHDWLVVFKLSNQYVTIVNNIEELKAFINDHKKSIFVGFNNYRYDDIILAGLLCDKDPYELTQAIFNNVFTRLKFNLLSLDVMQELPQGCGLKSSQANLGMNIQESDVDFNIDRKLTAEEIESTVDYCKNDVDTTELLFKKREDYFSTKFDLIQEFNLDASYLKKTRAELSAKVLNCKKITHTRDRLKLDFDPNINFDILPEDVVKFFNEISEDYPKGVSAEELESRKLKTNILGVPHVVAFGGLHGAIKNYWSWGNFLQIDVGSYYPALIINNNFMSRASQSPELYRKMRDDRIVLKKAKDPRADVYKIVLNATFGAMKYIRNPLYDPKQVNNICINGQLILIQLLQELDDKCQLIQSNTDGILIKYEDNFDEIMSIVDDFGARFTLTFDVDKINRVAQKDVNNYALLFDDGKVKAKGRWSKFSNSERFEQNNLSIIDRCLVNYYIHDISFNDTIMEAYNSDDILPFQLVAKMGSSFDSMVYEYDNEYIETQKVNRVFATNDQKCGGIYKVKDGRYHKISYTSENSMIFNDDIKKFDKKLLDLNFYKELVNNYKLI